MMILPFSARLRDTLLTLTLTLLSGCALIQDEPAQVAIVNPQQAQLAQVIHLANSNWPAARWWEAYDDPQLNMLINRALQNSPTMQAARLRISQSQSTVELAQSAMGLQATAVAAQNLSLIHISPAGSASRCSTVTASSCLSIVRRIAGCRSTADRRR